LKKLFKLIFGRTPTWQKVTLQILTDDLSDDNLVRLAQAAADKLWDLTNAPLFFAKYANPREFEVHVAITIEMNWSVDKYCELFDPQDYRVVSVEKHGGSDPHAYAYLLSRSLRGTGEFAIKDTTHWLFNMLGYGYASEVRMHCELAASLAHNIYKMESGKE
jgi:hypothetical protein